MSRRLALWIPLGLFLAFLVVVSFGLNRPPQTVLASRLVGKPLPEFDLPGRMDGHPGLKTADFRTGQPVLLNIFASWCVPCAVEAPQLAALKARGITVHAIAIRDRPEDVAGFVGRYGDPYARIGFDDRSRVQLALGSSGVPESFVIDGKGIIRHQHIGEIRPDQVDALVAELEAAR